MALKDILAAIRSDADAAIAAIDEESAAEVRAIAADAERRAADIEKAALARGAQLAEEDLERSARAARRDAAREQLDDRERRIVSLLTELQQRLARLRDEPTYAARFERLAHEALEELGDAAVALVDRRDVELARRFLPAVAIQAHLDTAGGLVLEDGAGASVLNTVEARFEAHRSELRRMAATSLRGASREVADGR